MVAASLKKVFWKPAGDVTYTQSILYIISDRTQPILNSWD